MRLMKEFSLETYAPAEFNGRGVTIWDTAKDEPVPWQKWSKATEGQITSMPVVGAGKYHPESLQLDAFAPGREVMLVREPDNQYDPNAVAVFDAPGRNQVGHIPRENAKAVGRGVEKGARAFSVWETVEGGQRVGLRIAIISASMCSQFADAMKRVSVVGYD